MHSRLITLASVMAQLPQRSTGGHKGTFGSVTLVAGSAQTPGAAILCALGALRSGVGLVRWATDRNTAQLAPTRPAELMLALRDGAGEPLEVKRWAEQLLAWRSAVVIGPGLGQSEDARALLEALLSHASSGLCLDADALNLLAQHPQLWAHVPYGTVLTPHPKEMARLCGMRSDAVLEAKADVAAAVARQRGCVVILKAAETVVATPDGEIVATEDEGISALGHGGTGDVLAGLVGGLLAQGLKPTLAAQAAVVLHRAAGQHAATCHGHTGVMASDVAWALGTIWAQWGR